MKFKNALNCAVRGIEIEGAARAVRAACVRVAKADVGKCARIGPKGHANARALVRVRRVRGLDTAK